MPDEIKDDAGFTATLTTDAQKAYFTNALKGAGEAAVTQFKTASEAERLKSIPEKYEFKPIEKSPLTLTEDGVKIAEFAKKQGLTAESAQGLFALMEERASALTARQLADYEREVTEWKQQVQNDKDLGGPNYTATLANVSRFMTRFGPAGSPFATLLDSTGYGSHPVIVAVLNQIGKMLGEGGRTWEAGGGGEKKEKTLAEALYGDKAKSA